MTMLHETPQRSTPRAAQLQGYVDAFRRSQREAHRITDPLSDAAFNWKPAPDAWSVAECLLHLNTIAAGYVPVMEEKAAAEHPTGTPPFRYGFVSRLFIRAVRPGQRSMPTAPAMAPPKADGLRSNADKAETLAAFDAWTDRYVAVVEDAEGLDLAKIKLASPFLRIMKLPLGAFLDALGQHALRHIMQAERVTQQPGFPAS